MHILPHFQCRNAVQRSRIYLTKSFSAVRCVCTYERETAEKIEPQIGERARKKIIHGRCISIGARVFSHWSPPPCVRERKSHNYVNWKLIIITILEFNISHTVEKRKNVKFRSLNSVLSCTRRQRGHDDIMLCSSNRNRAVDRRAEKENSFRAT